MIPAPHLNEHLKKYLSVTGMKPADILKAQRMPFLTFTAPYHDVVPADLASDAFVDQRDWIIRCPFPEFRFCIDILEKDGSEKGSIIGFVTRRENEDMRILAIQRDKNRQLVEGFQFVRIGALEGGNISCAGKIFRLKDLSDVTHVLKTHITPAKKEKLPENETLQKLQQALANQGDAPLEPKKSTADSRELFGTDYTAPLRELLDENLKTLQQQKEKADNKGLFEDSNVIMVDKDGKPIDSLTFDQSYIKDPMIGKLVNELTLENKRELIKRLLAEDFRRFPDEGMHKNLSVVFGRLDPDGTRIIIKKLLDDAQASVKKITAEQREVRDMINTVQGAYDQHKVMSSIKSFSLAETLANKLITNEADDYFLGIYKTVISLCYEYLAPQNFTAKVTPSANGKSVEWIQAREHYTTIHKKHEANNKNVKEGAVVNSDPKKAMTRTAGSRRAHSRILKSARFTYMRGQTIKVRATWCGPKEWKDSAGQTYRILTPVDSKP